MLVIPDRRLPGADEIARVVRDVITAGGGGVATANERANSLLRLATQSLAQGYRCITVVGDDTSFREVMQSIFDAGLVGHDVTVGFIPAVPDCDVVRTFGLPTDPRQAALHLLGEAVYDLDLGRVTALGSDGDELTAVFAQVSEVGSGATIARGAEGRRGSTRRIGRFIAYWKAILMAKGKSIVVTADRRTWEGKATGVIVGNCPFFHEGIRVSPRSFPGDGVLDVLVHHGPRSDMITSLPKAYRGEHLPHPRIAELRAKIGVTVEVVGTPMPVHADGWVIGTTPARYVVMPAAVRLKI